MPQKDQPRLSVPSHPFDKLLDALAVATLLVLAALPALYFNRLPDTIPQHFNPSGEADGFGSKMNLWILPVMGLLIFIMIRWLSRYPHQFNFLVKIRY